MLNKDFTKQPQMRKHVQNNFKERMQEINIGEG
jgi:hypothetical protein